MAMDPTYSSESIYNLIPSDWKEPPQPPRYVGKQRSSLETRMGKIIVPFHDYISVLGFSKRNNIYFCFSEVALDDNFLKKRLQNLSI